MSITRNLFIMLLGLGSIGMIAGCDNEKASSSGTLSELERLEAGEGTYPETSSRLLKPEDLQGKTAYQLKIMKNEIFARHGYVFKTPDMAGYFSRQPWYQPDSSFTEKRLSKTEMENVALIKSAEEKAAQGDNPRNIGTASDRRAIVKTWGERYAASEGLFIDITEYDLYDIDGDSDNDVICRYGLNGGGSGVSGLLAVFENRDEVLSFRAAADAGSTGNWMISKIVKAQDNIISCETSVWLPDDAHCCPSGKGSAIFELSGSALRQTR